MDIIRPIEIKGIITKNIFENPNKTTNAKLKTFKTIPKKSAFLKILFSIFNKSLKFTSIPARSIKYKNPTSANKLNISL